MKSTYKTKAREIIMAHLKDHPEQRLTAREIYEAVCNQSVEVNRTTIYRNLEHLCETGDLFRFKEPNQDAWYYQYSAEHENCDRHMHAQCSVCGKIFHLDKPFADSFVDAVLAEYGLDADPSKSIILGQCSKCRRMKKK
ncbi:MAG: transcriptional repressor [Acetatifactor sp.]|nr:transcriptional repressor [Acetatifactor sp.]